jgi:hypothetical protein
MITLAYWANKPEDVRGAGAAWLIAGAFVALRLKQWKENR